MEGKGQDCRMKELCALRSAHCAPRFAGGTLQLVWAMLAGGWGKLTAQQ